MVLVSCWPLEVSQSNRNASSSNIDCLDLAWLPFIYSIQARYLSIHPVHLGWARSAGIIGVYLAGYYIFRASNNEKNRFRTNPEDPRVK